MLRYIRDKRILHIRPRHDQADRVIGYLGATINER